MATTFGSDPNSQNTTFVQADPSTFRAVVQRLTGAPAEAQKRPVEMGPRRPSFKRKLEIKLGGAGELGLAAARKRGFGGGEAVMVSPVSTLDFMAATPSHEEEERRAVAEGGFFLHKPSPRAAAPRGAEPELLTLFPLHSPRG